MTGDLPRHPHSDPLERHGHNLQIMVSEEGVIQLAHPSFSAPPPLGKKGGPAARPARAVRGVKHLGSPPPSRIWLVTFTDIMALMLTFFVLTYAMSEPRNMGHEQMVQPTGTRTGTTTSPPFQSGPYDTITLPRVARKGALDLGYLQQVLEDRIAREPALKALRIERGARDMRVYPPEKLDPGVMAGLGMLLGTLSNRVVLEQSGAKDFSDLRAFVQGLENTGLQKGLPVRLAQGQGKTKGQVFLRIFPWK